MPAQMATGKEMKRVKTFINRYGQIQEGDIYQDLGGYAVERTGLPNRMAETPKGDIEAQKE
jgi:hypothetical protein